MKKIRVLHITSNRDGNIGGAEKLLLDLHQMFDAREFQFTYANLFSLGNQNDPYIQALKNRGLEHINFNNRHLASVPSVFQKLRRFIRSGEFDAIHTHLLHGSILGQIAGRSCSSSARILTRHFTNDVLRGNRILRTLEQRSLQAADKIIAVSKAVKQDVLEQGISEQKVNVVYNGIELKNFDRVLLTHPREQNSSVFRIATVGSLTERKGHEYLISAMAEVVKKHKDIRLTIIGDGPERHKLESLTDGLGIRGFVEFKGFRDDVAELVHEADIYVHPAIYEPFGIAVIEAMALQKYLIATNVGGVPEIVVDGETGILVNPCRPSELAEGIIWAYEHRPEASLMGTAGRRRVEEMFQLQRTVDGYTKIYQEEIEKRSMKVGM